MATETQGARKRLREIADTIVKNRELIVRARTENDALKLEREQIRESLGLPKAVAA